MITPGLEEKEEQLGSRYDLVLLAAQRAKQLQEGSAPLVRTSATHPLSIALEEIRAGAYPPVAKESASPKRLDEEFIGAELAKQDLMDLDSRFESTLGTVRSENAEVPSGVEADAEESVEE